MRGAGTVSGFRSSECGHFTLCFVVISGQNSKMGRSVKGRVPCDLGFMFGSVSVRVLIVLKKLVLLCESGCDGEGAGIHVCHIT